MGLFNLNNNKASEKTYEENGFIIGVDSHIIYHAPKIQAGEIYVLPNGTTGLKEQALMEMKNSKPKQIVVPGSFKKFNMKFMGFENLNSIVLQEGIEEAKCSFDGCKNAVDVKLPATIKRIGKNNYPITEHLTLPNGVIEIDTLFTSHDTNLISVNIPGTIKTIPAGAFNQCKNLQSITFNEGVETSDRDVFRGTNNLRTLEIPSTYNGKIDLPMEGRPGSNLRGNSKYDGTKFDEEQNNILKVRIKRGEKLFEFNIRRGDMPSIEIKQNRIQIKCMSSQLITSIDCNTLKQGSYSIENGNIIMQQQASFNQSSTSSSTTQTTTAKVADKQKEAIDKLELIFRKAITEHLDDEDFEIEGLYGTEKEQVIEYMRYLFMKQASLNIIRTDSTGINQLFRNAINMFGSEKEMSSMQDNLNEGGKSR